jgi:elongation factor G
MAVSTEQIRNVALIGAQSAGKTSLIEAILYQMKMINKMGSVEQGNTASDYDSMEKKRGFSIYPSLFHLTWQDCKINFLDTPGFTDFIGKLIPILRVVETALMVVSPSTAMDSETRRIWQYVAKEKVPLLMFVNKLDEEKMDFPQLVEEMEKGFSTPCLPLQVPLVENDNFCGFIDLISLKAKIYENGTVKDGEIPEELKEDVERLRKKLLEGVAETDDALIERYLEEEELSQSEMRKGLANGIIRGSFIPLICGSALKAIGIDFLLDTLTSLSPSPLSKKEITDNKSLSAFVFQTISETHLGEVSLFRVFSGTLSSGGSVYNSTKKKEEKVGQIYLLEGLAREETAQIITGDIGVMVKLKNTDTGDTFSHKENPVVFPPLDFPFSTTSVALKPKSQKDEQKMSTALAKLLKIDPLLKMEIDRESGQTIVSGTGEVHLEIMIERLRSEFNVEVTTGEPKVPYRETIAATAEAQGRYKRQTGGHGQYGDVWLRVKPLARGEGYKFVDKIKGGAIPSRYIPAVEKGVKEVLGKGILASYPVVDIEVTLFDGTYHQVDSSDIAFQIAGSIGLKKAVGQARLLLLEPIAEIEVEIPDEFMGETNGDLNSRRGRILEVEPFAGQQKIKAYVPLAGLHNYSTALRSMTQGRGTFTKKFSHYEKAPDEVVQRIIAEAKEAK